VSLAAGHFSELSDPGADFVFPFEAKAWVYTFNQLSSTVLYHFDHKFTNSENLLAEMADKFSFEF
jgi:hypothetical protein